MADGQLLMMCIIVPILTLTTTLEIGVIGLS